MSNDIEIFIQSSSVIKTSQPSPSITTTTILPSSSSTGNIGIGNGNGGPTTLIVSDLTSPFGHSNCDLVITPESTPSKSSSIIKKVPSIALLDVDTFSGNGGSGGGGSCSSSPRKSREASSPSRYPPLSLISPRGKKAKNKEKEKEKDISKEKDTKDTSRDQSPLVLLTPEELSTNSLSPSTPSPSVNRKSFENMDTFTSMITASLSDHHQKIDSNNSSVQPSPCTSPEEYSRNQYKPLPSEPDLLPISSPPPSHQDDEDDLKFNSSIITQELTTTSTSTTTINSTTPNQQITKKKGIFSGFFSKKSKQENKQPPLMTKSLPQTPLPLLNPPPQMSRSYDSIKAGPPPSFHHPSLLPPTSASSHYTPISPVPVTSPLKTSIIHNRNRGVSSLNSSGQQPRKSISQTDLGSIITATISSNNTPGNHTPKNQSMTFMSSNIYSPTFIPPYLAYSSQSVATDATWLMIVSNWSEWSEPHFRPLLTKYVYQGIPDRFRPTIWFHLSNMIPQLTTIPACVDLTTKHNLIDKAQILTPLSTPSTVTPTGTPGLRSQRTNSSADQNNNNNSNHSPTSPTTSPPNGLCTSGGNHHHKCFYHSILKHHSDHEEQIDVDIQRTFPEMPAELRDNYSVALANVLRAISLYDPELGYCQGISFVGSILVQKVQEEEAFHILLRLLEGVMRDFYIIGMRGLKLRLYQLSKLVKELFPKLHQHLEKIDLDYTIFASPWFLTAFSYHLSEECSEKILDIILLQGVEAFFSVGLAIFQIIEEDLLACSDSSQVMEYFRTNAKDKIDSATLMDTASRIGISSKQLYVFQQQFESEQKPNIPSEFNPDQTPKEKMKDPNWVVKKYKLKERINNLEEDLAVMKHEMHHMIKRHEEEKIELVKHLQEVTDRESSLLQTETNYHNVCKENLDLKTKLQQAEELNRYLAEEMRKMRSQVDSQIWNNNPKKSIQWS